MKEVYNLRIGDMLYNDRAYGDGNKIEKANIVGIIYKMTPKYVYYDVCARRHNDPDGEHFVTKDNRSKKSSIYNSIRAGSVGVSYANGTKRRRKIEDFS